MMRQQLISSRSMQAGCRSCITTACSRSGLSRPQPLSRLSLRSAPSSAGRRLALLQSTQRRSTAAAWAAAFSSQTSSPSPPPSSSAADAQTVIAYQDMGRNQPKLCFLASKAPSTESASPSSPPQLQELRITQQQQSKTGDAKTDKERVVDAFFTSSLARRVWSPLSGLLQHSMLPSNFPSSVSASYTPYTKWTFLQNICSTASGVLSMQCLLFAVGLGQHLAAPTAAAIQWVLKDGMGQLGGMLFGYVNASFDSDAKRWRMIAAVLLDAAALVEILTPVAPAALFLPLASVANVGKNIAWLSSSASRACIHRSFSKEENLADVTAKSTSQAIAGALVGTALGIAISNALPSKTAAMLCAFAVLSALHLSSTYISLCQVPLNTVNEQRGERLMTAFVRQQRVLSTEEVSKQESILRRYRSPLAPQTRLNSGPTLTELMDEFDLMQSLPAASSVASLDRLLDFYRGEAFLLTVRAAPASSSAQLYVISLAFLTEATSNDVLSGHLLQVHYRLAIIDELAAASSSSSASSASASVLPMSRLWSLLQQSLQWLRRCRQSFLQLLHHSQWNTEHLFLESDRQRRIQLLQRRGDRQPEGQQQQRRGGDTH